MENIKHKIFIFGNIVYHENEISNFCFSNSACGTRFHSIHGRLKTERMRGGRGGVGGENARARMKARGNINLYMNLKIISY